ncbi:HNH endonuclease [Kineococcus sp. SYSU DK018]|uniref:HNH endonuclease n=1 Tax=Kineococcus sp. SYSU DK018 TaxID=3383139 RepID=UPI003D7F1861
MSLCENHYQRRWRGLEDWDSLELKRPKRAKGEGTVNSQGYRVVKVWRDGRWASVGQHRVAFEEVLGRRLTGQENIHHRNGDRADNRTDGAPRTNQGGNLVSGNLELYFIKQPRGQEIGPKVDWGVEMIVDYLHQLDDDRLLRIARLGGQARTVLSQRS